MHEDEDAAKVLDRNPLISIVKSFALLPDVNDR
jgi:hypothetical protein